MISGIRDVAYSKYVYYLLFICVLFMWHMRVARNHAVDELEETCGNAADNGIISDDFYFVECRTYCRIL